MEMIAEVGRHPAGALPGADIVIGLGARHPSTNGMIRLRLSVDDDRVTAAEPVVGFLHRGAEKLFEVRDYRQILSLANRHDWLASFGSELAVCLAVETMMGIEVPARATWLRTLLAELTRVLHHLHFLGSAPASDAALAVAGPRAAHARAQLQHLLEEVSGGRVHFVLGRIGGLGADLPDGWLDHLDRTVADVRAALADIGQVLDEDDEFSRRTRDVGVLMADVASSFGASGPLARAGGLDLDLRRDAPYLAYAELGELVTVVGAERGDAATRFDCLLRQCAVSTGLVLACADRLPDGPVDVRLPKIVTPPEGHTYAAVENPAGIAGVFLVSRGEKTPWRLALRTPSYANVQALPALLVGARTGDLPAIVSSVFFTVGDIDK